MKDIIIRIAAAILAALLVALATDDLRLHADPAITIGVECNQFHVFGYGYWFITPEHPVFIDSAYFYGTMQRCGMDHDWGSYNPDLELPDGVAPFISAHNSILSGYGINAWLVP